MVRLVQHPGAVDEIEVDVDALARFIAGRAVHMHGAHIQTLEQRVLVQRLRLRDTLETAAKTRSPRYGRMAAASFRWMPRFTRKKVISARCRKTSSSNPGSARGSRR